jgi:chromosome partitioning protein
VRRIALVNMKGGSGKTTTATALAVGLARRGRRTLFVDADPQANATWTLLGGRGADPPSLADVLNRLASADEAIRPTPARGLDLLPADASLGGVNVALAQQLSRDTRLRSALAAVEGRYDYLVADTSPSFNPILANVLVAGAEVVVPLDAGVYAVLGLLQLEETIAEVREAYDNRALRLAGLVLTKVARNNVSRDVEAEVRSRFGPLVYAATIPLNAKVEEAHTHGKTVTDYAPRSSAAVAYEQLVEEVIHGRAEDRGGGKAVGGAGTVGAA